MTTLSELLAMDELTNTSCHWCNKNIILKEGVIEGTDEEAFVLCEYCSRYDSFDEVKESYAEHLSEIWTGLYPLEIDYL
jgi:hypothetical protein